MDIANIFLLFPEMSLPLLTNIEMPILHELDAVGGTDDVKFLYERLISYFPSLSDGEIYEIARGTNKKWKSAVQKAGKSLDERRLIRRNRGLWQITDSGRRAAANENQGFTLYKNDEVLLNHQIVQQMIVDTGEILGFYAQKEYEFYDVVWRESVNSPRISHVFEVQSKGNIDSAFAKLKRAFDAQRSKPFLILSTERDNNRAHKSLAQEFRELEQILTVWSFAEMKKIHDNCRSIADFLPKLLEI